MQGDVAGATGQVHSELSVTYSSKVQKMSLRIRRGFCSRKNSTQNFLENSLTFAYSRMSEGILDQEVHSSTIGFSSHLQNGSSPEAGTKNVPA